MSLAGAIACALALPAAAAQLSADARSAIPKDIQQLIAVDYRAMQNSTAAMDLKNRVLPPEIKQLEDALKTSGLNENHDVDALAFASFRTSDVAGDAHRRRRPGAVQPGRHQGELAQEEDQVHQSADQPRLSDGRERDGGDLP